MLLTHVGANLSTQPDGTFVSFGSLRSGRVKLVEGAHYGCVELQGTPDMVLEVVSDSSAQKDTVVLLDLYRRAGIPEYWLVDARGDPLVFNIFRRLEGDYAAVPAESGWIESGVFGASFQLTRRTDRLGHPELALAVRQNE